MDGENVEPLMDKGGGDVVLGGQRIASSDEHLGTTIGENLAKACCLGFKMDRKAILKPLNGLLPLNSLSSPSRRGV